MSEICVNFLKTVRIRHFAGMLALGLLYFVSAGSASVTPLPETKQGRTPVSLRQNYCMGDVASLGTGLVRVPVQSEPQYSKQKARPWTGWIRASASGKYEFSLPDSSGRIFVNKQEVFSRSAMSPKPAVTQIELLTNRFYAIVFEAPGGKETTLELQWRRPDGRREPVPKAYLYAPVATVGTNEMS